MKIARKHCSLSIIKCKKKSYMKTNDLCSITKSIRRNALDLNGIFYTFFVSIAGLFQIDNTVSHTSRNLLIFYCSTYQYKGMERVYSNNFVSNTLKI